MMTIRNNRYSVNRLEALTCRVELLRQSARPDNPPISRSLDRPVVLARHAPHSEMRTGLLLDPKIPLSNKPLTDFTLESVRIAA